MPPKKKEDSYKVHVGQDVKSGKYSNAFGIHIKPREVVLDFGFSQPNTNDIDIISRIILNHEVAEEFMRTLQNSLLDYRSNKNKPSSKK